MGWRAPALRCRLPAAQGRGNRTQRTLMGLQLQRSLGGVVLNRAQSTTTSTTTPHTQYLTLRFFFVSPLLLLDYIPCLATNGEPGIAA